MPPKADFNEVLQIQSTAYKEATQMIFDSLNGRVNDLFKTVIELQHSLEFSQAELKDTRDSLAQATTELNECKVKLREQENMMIKQQDRLDNLEDYSRKNNIRIDGFEEPPNETKEVLHVKIKKLLEDKLQIKDVNIDNIHRLFGDKKNNQLHVQYLQGFQITLIEILQ